MIIKNIILSIMLIACSCYVSAIDENQTINVKLEAIIPENITMGLVYDSLFKITNLNYVKGVESKINVTVYYNITQTDDLIYSANFSRIVNSFSTASTGFLFIETPGNYLLCGQTLNSSSCKQFEVINPKDIFCNVSLITSLDKNVFENHERIDIKNKIVSNEDYPYIIEYWIEDLFGNEIKKKVNTTNDNDKTFTPDIDEKSAVYFLKSKLVYVGCNNLMDSKNNEIMFAIKNQEFIAITQQALTDQTSTISSTKKPIAEIYSFYTRSKNYKPEINIYANLKGDGEATVIFYSDIRQQIRKVNLPEKPVFIGEAVPGSNKYQLELYISGELIDSQDLIVNLAGELPTPKTAINKTKNTTKITPVKKPVITPLIQINESIKNTTEELITPVVNKRDDDLNQIRSSVIEEPVYESTSTKEKNVAPSIGIGVLVLIAIGVVLFKTK